MHLIANARIVLNPDQDERVPWISQQLAQEQWPVVATSDYMKAIPHRLSPWITNGFRVLGTDGFGRSETREALRDFFETDAKHVAYAALYELAQAGKFDAKKLAAARDELSIAADRPSPTLR